MSNSRYGHYNGVPTASSEFRPPPVRDNVAMSFPGLRHLVRTNLRRVRERWRPALARVARLSSAAVASYLLALHIVADPRPVTAALTALLIVQVTLVGTIADTGRRILSVVLGVAVAIGVSRRSSDSPGGASAPSSRRRSCSGRRCGSGRTSWRCRSARCSILAAGGAGCRRPTASTRRLIGAGAGLLINLIFPPSVQTRDAGVAVERFAESIARLLDRAARSLTTKTATRDEVRSAGSTRRARSPTTSRPSTASLTAARREPAAQPARGRHDRRDSRSAQWPRALEHSAVALARRVPFARGRRSGLHVRRRRKNSSKTRISASRSPSSCPTSPSRSAASARWSAPKWTTPINRTPTKLAAPLDAVREARVRLTELLLVDPRRGPRPLAVARLAAGRGRAGPGRTGRRRTHPPSASNGGAKHRGVAPAGRAGRRAAALDDPPGRRGDAGPDPGASAPGAARCRG